MSEKIKINFEDFKLENVLDPDYKPAGLAPEPVIEPVEPVEPKVVEPPKVVEKGKKKVEPEPEPEPDLTQVPEEDGTDKEGAGDANSPNEIDFKPFYQLFHEELGWEVPEDEQPENSVKGLLEYMNKLVTESSVPKYSDPIVEQFDKFIADNGNPVQFMKTMFGSKDYSAVKLESDSDKKQVLKDYFNTFNSDKSEEWIDKKIARYEDSGVIDDESVDALEELKAHFEKEKAELVTRQQADAKAKEEAYRAQLRDLETSIRSKTEIANIPVTKKDADGFFNYLTKRDREGLTDYDKAILKDREAVIKMAYVAYKNFDVNNLKSAVKSDITKELKKSLSKFSSSTTGLTNKTTIPVKSNSTDYKAFDTGL